MESRSLRRRTMQAVRSKNTAPEMYVRRLLHRRGYRYSLHREDLPGRPDIVFSSRRKVIFVHGCFWHGHNCRRGHRVPKSNTEYWTAKIARNRSRDIKTRKKLRTAGWSVLVLWECWLRDDVKTMARLERFLEA